MDPTCPVKLLTICLKLAHEVIGISPPTLDELKALNVELCRGLPGLSQFAVDRSPCFSQADGFPESAAKLEIEIMEKLDFNLATRNSFRQLSAVALEAVEKQDALKLHAIACSLILTEQAWRQSPTNLGCVFNEIYRMLYQSSSISNSELFLKDNPQVAANILSELHELYRLFE